MTERAVLLTPGEARAASPAELRPYTRAHLGSAVCAALLASPAEVAALRARGLEVTLQTPLFSGAGLRKFLKTLDKVLEKEKTIEVSANDLGLLDILRRRYRGRALPLLGRPVSHDFLRMDQCFLRRFLADYGIALVESDEADMVRALPAVPGFGVAFHYPLACLAMSRFCPHEGRMGGACARPCSGRAEALRGPGGGSLVLRCGGYFKVNRRCRAGAVKRLVEDLAGRRLAAAGRAA